jgi:ABC-type lipoprotein release transport system permease subunit
VIDKDLFLDRVKEKLAEKIVGFDENLFEGISYNQILLKTDNVEQTSTIIKNYYESGATSSKLVYMHGREEVESVNLLKEEVIQSQKMIYVFPIIFLVVAVLIILTTIDQLIMQEQKKIGILKACGVPNKKILRHYSLYGAILCTIGAGLGVILGLVLIPEVMFSRYGTIYSIPEDYIKLQIPVWWLVALTISMIIERDQVAICLECHQD